MYNMLIIDYLQVINELSLCQYKNICFLVVHVIESESCIEVGSSKGLKLYGIRKCVGSIPQYSHNVTIISITDAMTTTEVSYTMKDHDTSEQDQPVNKTALVSFYALFFYVFCLFICPEHDGSQY